LLSLAASARANRDSTPTARRSGIQTQDHP
jgi:hypothetical protein